MPEYHKQQRLAQMPRLPLHGSIDLTYRCNNVCRHCWLWLAENAAERAAELTLDEIVRIADQARALGCREWAISGGEPLLRPDFPEIFDYLTRKAITYSLNTNGTLITPEIAQLLTRKGTKMIALYGATAEVYDAVTRHPGGFDAAMRGFRYMQEAGAGFTVQLIPMRDNWHEWEQMQALAKSLSPHQRVGAPWLYQSACGSPARNAEIERQRLSPHDVIALDRPDPAYGERMEEVKDEGGRRKDECEESSSFIPHPSSFDDRLFAACIAGRRDFHIDAYGMMSWCSFVKDPALRYNLRRGAFREAWEEFIPACADKVRGGDEWRANCGSCAKRADCRWCAVYAYLETGRYAAPIPYLCAVAHEKRAFQENWLAQHRRFYQIAGITIQVDADLPIVDGTFHPKFERFAVGGPDEDTVSVRHHFSLAGLRLNDLGREVYRKPPWAIYERGDAWVYLGISPRADTGDHEGWPPHRVVTFNHDHTRARIYNDGEETWRKGGLHSLTLFPSDQILIARLLADRQGCYLHSAGAILDGQGLLFVGHSDAGKTTMVRMLLAYCHSEERSDEESRSCDDETLRSAQRDMVVEILCDDRNIVRRTPAGFRVYGTWSHGESPLVSPASAPLRAILFLDKAAENRLTPLADRREVTRRLLACLIKPFVTADWWEKTLALVEQLAREAPAYALRFDRSGTVVELLREMCHPGLDATGGMV